MPMKMVKYRSFLEHLGLLLGPNSTHSATHPIPLEKRNYLATILVPNQHSPPCLPDLDQTLTRDDVNHILATFFYEDAFVLASGFKLAWTEKACIGFARSGRLINKETHRQTAQIVVLCPKDYNIVRGFCTMCNAEAIVPPSFRCEKCIKLLHTKGGCSTVCPTPVYRKGPVAQKTKPSHVSCLPYEPEETKLVAQDLVYLAKNHYKKRVAMEEDIINGLYSMANRTRPTKEQKTDFDPKRQFRGSYTPEKEVHYKRTHARPNRPEPSLYFVPFEVATQVDHFLESMTAERTYLTDHTRELITWFASLTKQPEINEETLIYRLNTVKAQIQTDKVLALPEFAHNTTKLDPTKFPAEDMSWLTKEIELSPEEVAEEEAFSKAYKQAMLEVDAYEEESDDDYDYDDISAWRKG